MIALAIVAVSLGTAMWIEKVRRVYVRQKMAFGYAESERYWLERARVDAKNQSVDGEVKGDIRMARYLAACEQIYRQAAAHPWEPIPTMPSLDDFTSSDTP
jgi:hypothetical protein